jgi:hypothetical protein
LDSIFAEFSMRKVFPVLVAALALAACGHNDHTDKTQNVDENLTAENIVSNDVTAIDAVTGDASNMAADMNYQHFDNTADNGTDSTATKPSRPHKAAPANDGTSSSSAPKASTPATTPPGNATE